MLKTFIIGYDLLKAGQDYTTLYEKIRSLGTHIHEIDSTWIVKTAKTANQIRDFLKQYMDSNDKLFVAELVPSQWSTYGFSAESEMWLLMNA